MKTWIIIPAHNESEKIGSVIDDVKKYCKNIVVVDDGSRDDTYGVAKSKKVVVLRHIVNLGKGAALKTGCDYVTKKEESNIIAIDADGQHEPKEIPKFLEALEEADIVFGVRKLNKNMPAVFRFGNWFINFVTYILYGLKLRDTQCGYRAFSTETYKRIRWNASDYSMESEMITNAGKKRLKYKEIPIETIYADKYKGTTVIDGIKVVLRMLGWRIFK